MIRAKLCLNKICTVEPIKKRLENCRMIGSYKKVKRHKILVLPENNWVLLFLLKENVDIAIHILTIYNRTLFIINNKTVLSKYYFYWHLALIARLKQTIYVFEFTYHKVGLLRMYVKQISWLKKMKIKRIAILFYQVFSRECPHTLSY